MENVMKQSGIFRENAEHCAQLAERASDKPAYRRYRRMEAAWLALAYEQDWLDGEIAPIRPVKRTAVNLEARGSRG
jgi:hypothetical protein